MKNLREKIFLLVILGISGTLRFLWLDQLMAFIPDQGWFYLSARDMLLTGNIPLVGPQTSHPWIHHGALWTYALAGLLHLGNFDPVFPGYFIALLGVITVFIFYKIVKSQFDRTIAMGAAMLYATSPLIVMNARIPYHTSPIPFFVILLFFTTYKWVKGSAYMFPLVMFLLAVLYNHEITTFVYAIAVFLIFCYGYLKKTEWFKQILHLKILLISIFSFLIPMIPFFLYDIHHGYRQTFGFLFWVFYRIVKLPLSVINPSFQSSGSNPSTIPEFLLYYQQLLFSYNKEISLFLLFVALLYSAWYMWTHISISKTRKVFWFYKFKTQIHLSYALLFLFLGVGIVGLFVHRVPIEADTLLISPFIIILTALSILWICKNNTLPFFMICIFISAYNMLFLINTNLMTNMGSISRITFQERMDAVETVIKLSRGKQFTIVGKGELSDFPVFLMPYEYLLWWSGYPVSFFTNNKIVIEEKNGNVYVE